MILGSSEEKVRIKKADALTYLREQISMQRHWADALLEAMGLWNFPEEQYAGRSFTYLIDGEAFDWLLLAERLLMEIPDVVSLEEKQHLFFNAKLPDHVTETQFSESLGVEKYRAHLNFFYGVVVEEALIFSMEQEVSKEGKLRGFVQGNGLESQVYKRLYGEDREALLKNYLGEKRRRIRKNFTLTDLKSFTYWLFKLRIKRNDGARNASDTRKGLKQLDFIRQSVNKTDLLVPADDQLERTVRL